MSSWEGAPIADVRALPGIRYDISAGDLSSLVAPPYDVVPEPDLSRYRALSPYNVIRLTRPGTDYEGAARTFAEWLRDGILRSDPPAVYIHEVAFGGRGQRGCADGRVRGPRRDRAPTVGGLRPGGPCRSALGI